MHASHACQSGARRAPIDEERRRTSRAVAYARSKFLHWWKMSLMPFGALPSSASSFSTWARLSLSPPMICKCGLKTSASLLAQALPVWHSFPATHELAQPDLLVMTGACEVQRSSTLPRQ